MRGWFTIIALLAIGYALGAMFPGPFNQARAAIGV